MVVAVIAALTPAGAGTASVNAAGIMLPWTVGQAWSTNGPHTDTGAGTAPRNAIDVSGGDGHVLAAGDGTVRLGSCSGGQNFWIDHPGGWRTAYYHVTGVRVTNGQTVRKGDWIATTGTAAPCGGSASGNQVHFSLWKDGAPYSLNGLSLGGWTIRQGSSNYLGSWTRDSDGYTYNVPSTGFMTCGCVNNDGSGAGGGLRGSFDGASSPAPGQLRIGGWALDDDVKTTAVSVHVYVGGPAGSAGAQGFDIGAANLHRPDVGAAFPGVGDYHGFERTLDVAKFGSQPVYVYAINAPGTPGGNVLLGTRTVNIPQPNPFGSLDSAESPRAGWLRVAGWTADPSAPTTPLDVHVYAGATMVRSVRADLSRTDVGAALPGYGNLHGYDATFPAPAGTYSVCSYGLNVGVGNDNTQLGCRSVTVARDTVAPQTTVTAGPPATGTTTTVSFAFVADEPGATFSCQWDGGAWGACASPAARTLPLGAHTFSVRATDPSGNVDATPATSSFTIAAPATVGTPPPGNGPAGRVGAGARREAQVVTARRHRPGLGRPRLRVHDPGPHRTGLAHRRPVHHTRDGGPAPRRPPARHLPRGRPRAARAVGDAERLGQAAALIRRCPSSLAPASPDVVR